MKLKKVKVLKCFETFNASTLALVNIVTCKHGTNRKKCKSLAFGNYKAACFKGFFVAGLFLKKSLGLSLKYNSDTLPSQVHILAPTHKDAHP